MAVADISSTVNGGSSNAATAAPAAPVMADPHSEEAAASTREKFLPVTRHALLDRLTQPGLWPNGDASQTRRFMRYLDYWRRHS